jgi:hypothetical protein
MHSNNNQKQMGLTDYNDQRRVPQELKDRAFTLRQMGKSTDEVASILNAEGFTKTNGKEFTKQDVSYYAVQKERRLGLRPPKRSFNDRSIKKTKLKSPTDTTVGQVMDVVLSCPSFTPAQKADLVNFITSTVTG